MTDCAGCQSTLEEAGHLLGLAIKRTYCADCATLVQAYLDELDGLHTRHERAFQKDLAALRKKHLKSVWALPDMS